MNATDRYITRTRIVKLAEAAGEHGLTAEYLRASLRVTGPSCTEEEVQAEIVYLWDKNFLARVPRTISPELARYRITAAGRDWLASEEMA